MILFVFFIWWKFCECKAQDEPLRPHAPVSSTSRAQGLEHSKSSIESIKSYIEYRWCACCIYKCWIKSLETSNLGLAISKIVCFLTTPNFTLISHLNPSVTLISPWIYASPFSLVSRLFLLRAFRDFTNLMGFVTRTCVKGTRLISFIYLFHVSY